MTHIIQELMFCSDIYTLKYTKTLSRLFEDSVQEKVKLDNKTEDIKLIGEYTKFKLAKFKFILSESTVEEHDIGSMGAEELRDTSTGIMKESTRHDLAMSERSSHISTPLATSKLLPDNGIDLLCLELCNISYKFKTKDEADEEKETNARLDQFINFFKEE